MLQGCAACDADNATLFLSLSFISISFASSANPPHRRVCLIDLGRPLSSWCKTHPICAPLTSLEAPRPAARRRRQTPPQQRRGQPGFHQRGTQRLQDFSSRPPQGPNCATVTSQRRPPGLLRPRYNKSGGLVSSLPAVMGTVCAPHID